MPVPVMHVGEVVMAVCHRRMNVFVGVGFRSVVSMLVVRVMHVAMAMAQRFVGMAVGVPFADVQPDANGHQYAGRPECPSRRFAQ